LPHMRHITPVDTKHHHILERFAGIDPVRLLRQGYRTRVLKLSTVLVRILCCFRFSGGDPAGDVMLCTQPGRLWTSSRRLCAARYYKTSVALSFICLQAAQMFLCQWREFCSCMSTACTSQDTSLAPIAGNLWPFISTDSRELMNAR
jgi:hypothetical protein